VSGLVIGRPFVPRDRTMLAMAGGDWVQQTYLEPIPILQAGELEDALVGIYLITDAADRIVWLGRALRHQGIAGRLRSHLQKPERRAVFRNVRAVRLDDFTLHQVVDSIEGKAADRLRLRGTLGPRRWPPAGEIPARVGDRTI
jgi:hypothetical protein